MTKWWDDQVAIDGLVSNVLFGDLDAILSLDWRLACWLEQDAVLRRQEDGGRSWTHRDRWSTAPADGDIVIGGWDHDHCEVSFCGVQIGGERGEDRRVAFVAQQDNENVSWLCRQCGEALLRWWETAECRAYMERRARGLAGPPG